MKILGEKAIEIPNQHNSTKKEVYCFINWALYICYDEDLLLVMLSLGWLHFKIGFLVVVPYLTGKRTSLLQEQSKHFVLIDWYWTMDPTLNHCFQGKRFRLMICVSLYRHASRESVDCIHLGYSRMAWYLGKI